MGKQQPVASGRIVALSPDDGSAIDLKRPALAAVLSWLVPGLGQLVQGRRLKGLVFMATLVPTFLFGMWLGDGRVVYVGGTGLPPAARTWARSACRWSRT